MPGLLAIGFPVAIASALENYAKESGYGISVTCEVGFQLSPDLAVEILSPSDRPNAVGDKIKDYLDAGAHVVWIVEPQRRYVVVYTPGGRRVISVDETLDAPGLLPGFLLVLRNLFTPPDSLP